MMAAERRIWGNGGQGKGIELQIDSYGIGGEMLRASIGNGVANELGWSRRQ